MTMTKTTPPEQPPVDNAHVASDCEQFTAPAAGKIKIGFGQKFIGDQRPGSFEAITFSRDGWTVQAVGETIIRMCKTLLEGSKKNTGGEVVGAAPGRNVQWMILPPHIHESDPGPEPGVISYRQMAQRLSCHSRTRTCPRNQHHQPTAERLTRRVP